MPPAHTELQPSAQPHHHQQQEHRTSRGSGTDSESGFISLLLVDDGSVANRKRAAAVSLRRPTARQDPPPSKILFLDGLRGLAAILVVAQHAGFSVGGANLGAVGVDVFFVLSAFLLTMIMEKKCLQLVETQATARQWALAMVDYFTKRFLRVYPLFALVAAVLWIIPAEEKKRYYLIAHPEAFNLLKVLAFETGYRYHVLWTLPLEISFYFVIPVLAIVTLKLGRTWWLLFLPLFVWIVYEGFVGYRTSHTPLLPHLPTFLAGSVAAVVYLKIDSAVKTHMLQPRRWQRRLFKAVNYLVLALLVLTVGFNGWYLRVLFNNVEQKQPVGFPFVSVLVTIIIVMEMLLPSKICGFLESSFLRYWGKVSFSTYLLHSFVIYRESVRTQALTYRVFSVFAFTMLLATFSYHLVEHPMQELARKASTALSRRAGALAVPQREGALQPVHYGSIPR